MDLYTYTTVTHIVYVAVTSCGNVTNVVNIIVDMEVTDLWFLLLTARVGSATYWPSYPTASSWTRTRGVLVACVVVGLVALRVSRMQEPRQNERKNTRAGPASTMHARQLSLG